MASKMIIKKKYRLTIAILTIVAFTGFIPFVFETSNRASDDYVMNSPKMSSSITITQPNSSSSWETSSAEWIFYTTTPDIYYVNITLYKDGILEREIDEWIPVTNSFYWLIPFDVEDSNQYQIKIADYLNSSTYDFSDYFEIKEPSEEPPSDGSPTIPGYSLYILMSIIGLFSVILVKRRILK